MFSKLEYKAYKIIGKYVVANFDRIKVDPGICRWNFRCGNNAVHDAIVNEEDQIALVIYNVESNPIIHFINFSKDGKFIDNTLGQWATQYQYYLIKMIGKEDFFNIQFIWTALTDGFNRRIPCWIKLFTGKMDW